MPDKQWKRRERQIEADFGGQRIPSMGFALPDVRVPPGEQRPHPGLAIESKCWSGVQPRFFDALEQARRNAKNGEIPVVVISESTRVKRSRRFAVVLDYDAFAAIFGPDAAAKLEGVDDEG